VRQAARYSGQATVLPQQSVPQWLPLGTTGPAVEQTLPLVQAAPVPQRQLFVLSSQNSPELQQTLPQQAPDAHWLQVDSQTRPPARSATLPPPPPPLPPSLAGSPVDPQPPSSTKSRIPKRTLHCNVPRMNVLARLTATPARRTALALAGLMALVVLPFAGSFGLWDPWETHYGEVARQMLARNDFISLWWPGSGIDHAPRGEFWSKPVLTFWLEALSMKLYGLQWANARADELVTSWRAEWAVRTPAMLLSFCTIGAVFALLERIAGRRAAAIGGVALLTSPQWLLITRQAMTDMPFASMMTIALCLAALALLAPDETPLPRRGNGRFTWPHAPAFYGFIALFVVAALPQLLVDCVQLHAFVPLGGRQIVVPGLVPMLPYVVGFFVAIWWCARVTTRRQLYLLAAWVLCALASLAKGPAGLALPAIILGLYLVCAGRWRDILRLELLRGALVFVVVGFPWWHANLIRHGAPFWNEQIGDNYLNRATGRNGDRGMFDYYWQFLGYGIFPWTGPALLGALAAFLRPKTARQALARFALVWMMVDVVTITLVNTKFHHYVLPALPAAIILGALFIDDVLTAPRRWHAVALGLVAAPLTFAAGRDLAQFPARFLFMFDYDYVLIPVVGRPWPSPAIYGNRYEYGGPLMMFAVAAGLAVVALALVAARGRAVADPDEPAPARGRLLALVVATLAALALGILAGPSTVNGAAPSPSAWLWLLPCAFMLAALALVARTTRASAAWAIAAVAIINGAFVSDRYMPELGPHWSQKHVVAAYYANRSGHDEPLVVWNLYWRGENFYSRNEVYDTGHGDIPWAWTETTKIDKPKFFERHKGHRIFFLVERNKLESLRMQLPATSRQLKVVDDSNNKLLLVQGQF
jgi:4-amino-4-deoxy-L-arabinose transferase-like glycosyltransferase